MILHTIKKSLESRMLGNSHVRFGVGGGVQFPALHHPKRDESVAERNWQIAQSTRDASAVLFYAAYTSNSAHVRLFRGDSPRADASKF